jgi:hypothetical protein
MTHAVHLSDDLLIRSIDMEPGADLTIEERLYAERHLAACASCRRRRQEWAQSLDLVETAVAEVDPVVPVDSRRRLATALGEKEAVLPGDTIVKTSSKTAWWQLAVAASVACAVLSGLALRPYFNPTGNGNGTARQAVAETLETDYVPLPYSTAVVSPAEAQVVRVEMPASALRDAGIFVASADDEYLDADVLLGLDGQPQGIRLVNTNTSMLN